MLRLWNYGQDKTSIINKTQELKIHHYSCDYFESYKDCIVLKRKQSVSPAQMCLYNEEGKNIDISCLRRGVNRNKIVTKAPKNININTLNLKRVNKKCIYIGAFVKHWGHLLSESLARVWIFNLNKYKEYYFLHYGNPSKEAFFLLKYLGINKPKLIEVSENCIIDEVIIPYPSMTNRGEIFTTHAETLMKISKNVMSDLSTSFSEVSRPLYLSRTRLHKSIRAIKGEKQIENYLISRGANVEYFENLCIEEQIYLINRHKVIISPFGSALHNVLFSLNSKHILCLANNSINVNQYMIDEINKNYTTWLNCSKVDENSSKPGIRKDFIIKDVENTIQHINSFLANV